MCIIALWRRSTRTWMKLLRKADGSWEYSVISIRQRLMVVWTVSLLFLRILSMSDIWCSWFGRLIWHFLQFASGLCDTSLLQLLLARISKNQNLILQVANKVTEMHEDVVKQIQAKTQRSATLPSPESIVQQMPLKPAVFHGRDVIIEEITQLLIKEETSRVCILGAGGMGKTSVALGVVEQSLIKARFLPENIVWIPCIEATSATLLLEILCTQLQVPWNIGQPTIEKIISLLATSTQPCLLDNFETPYFALDGVLKQVEDNLRRLAMLSHVAILITMRGRYLPCAEAIKWQSKEIQPTDEAACLLVYRSIHPESETILMSVGCFAFWDTCLLLWHSWQDWARKGTQRRVDSNIVRERAWNPPWPLWTEHEPKRQPFYWQQPDEAEPSSPPPEYSLLPTCRNSENKSSLVDTSTLLSNGGWNFSMVPSAIATLSKTGLLVENRRQDSDSPVFFVLFIVQSFIQQHGRIGKEIRQNILLCCSQYILDHVYG